MGADTAIIEEASASDAHFSEEKNADSLPGLISALLQAENGDFDILRRECLLADHPHKTILQTFERGRYRVLYHCSVCDENFWGRQIPERAGYMLYKK